MDVSLSDLRAFHEVAGRGSVSAASRALGLSQPTLSATIKKLESALDCQLFLRTNRGVVLTRAGQALLERGGDLLNSWSSLRDHLHAVGDQVRGTFTLGLHEMVGAITLPHFVADLMAEYARLDFKLIHGLSRHIAEEVIAHRVDFGIVVNPPRHPELTIVRLYDDDIGIWRARGNHPLQALDADDALLISNPHLLQTDPLINSAIDRGLLRCGRTLHTTDLNLICRLVAAGAGLGVLPTTVALERAEDHLELIPDSPLSANSICLIYHGDAQKSHAAKTIKEVIIDRLRQRQSPASRAIPHEAKHET